jgi:hypothetical protein
MICSLQGAVERIIKKTNVSTWGKYYTARRKDDWIRCLKCLDENGSACADK